MIDFQNIPTTLKHGVAPYHVELRHIMVGADSLIIITGGSHPHIGAVSIIDPLMSSPSTLERPRHKEGDLLQEITLKLGPYFEGGLTVTMGVHIDNAKKIEISILSRNIIELVEKFITTLIISI